MTKIKLCGLTRPCDIEHVNKLLPEYIGFVFTPTSRRYISPEKAEQLRKILDYRIVPVGVFVDENTDEIADLVKRRIIDVVQLHGNESEQYIKDLRRLIDSPIIKAFRIESNTDMALANKSSADYVLLDSGGGTGKVFDHSLLKDIARPYFLAGGLTHENVKTAVKQLAPFAVDASTSLETDGFKDENKIRELMEVIN